MSLAASIQHYQDLLLYQYRNQPRARATIAIYVKQALADMLAEQLFTAYNLDSAVGNQLDVLGKYIGVSRLIGDPVARPYYAFSDYSGYLSPNGFTDYLNASMNAQAIWYQYQFSGTQNTALTDEAYLTILKLKIILNSNDGTLASIQDLLHTFLPGVVALTDNADMTLTYTLSASTPVSPNVLKAYLPKPMGVGINFITLGATYPTPIAKTLNTPHGDHGLHTVTSDPFDVIVTNGVGPFTYLWNRVSGAPEVTPSYFSNAPTSRFSMQGIPSVTKSAVYQCTVTDSRGIVALSNLVNVTLTIQELP